MDTAKACIAITSKNRKEELYECVLSALRQTIHVEILVIDDGSTDGTSEMLSNEFPLSRYPNIRVNRSEQSLGLIAQRSRFPLLTKCPYIVSIDDDAIFVSKHTVAQTLSEFNHPRIGAVAIPYIDINYSQDIKQRAPDDQNYLDDSSGYFWVAEQFRGTAHALRRDVFLALGGYRPQLIRQGEEGDYCIRMLNLGYVVRMGAADPIHHMESPKRSRPEITYYTARNNLLFAWHNVPMPDLCIHLPATIYKNMIAGYKGGYMRQAMSGIIYAMHLCITREWRERKPVLRSSYSLSRRLRKCGPMRSSALDKLLQGEVSVYG